MNKGQFKDPLCYLCLLGAVVPSLSLMQEVVGSRHNYCLNFVNGFTYFGESHLGKTPISQLENFQHWQPKRYSHTLLILELRGFSQSQ